MRMKGGQLIRHHRLRILGFLLAAVIFVFDALTPLGIAGGVPYVVLIFLAFMAHSVSTVFWLTGLSILFTVCGLLLSPDPIAPWSTVIINRILSVLAIGVTGVMASFYLTAIGIPASLAGSDPLTGTYTRDAFLDKVREHIEQRQLGPHFEIPLSLLVMEVHPFSQSDDQDEVGKAGFLALRQVAQVLQQHTRRVDLICRYNDIGFAILLPLENLEGARTLAEHLQRAFAADGLRWGNLTLRPTVHIGVAEWLDKEWDADTFLAEALSDLERHRGGMTDFRIGGVVGVGTRRRV